MTGSALAGLSAGRRTCRPPWVTGSVAVVDPGSGDSRWLDTGPLEALRLESRALRLLSEETRARARATRHEVRVGRSRREERGEPAFARLRSRLATMPVIEQAKGIVMAQQGCGPEEAFDLLRRASQRNNVKVHELAEQIVKVVASGKGVGNVTSITVGSTRYRQP
jgi:ANTAR domain-containing protein